MSEKPVIRVAYRGLSLSLWKNDDGDRRAHVSLQRSNKYQGKYIDPVNMKLWYSSINVLNKLTSIILKEIPDIDKPLDVSGYKIVLDGITNKEVLSAFEKGVKKGC